MSLLRFLERRFPTLTVLAVLSFVVCGVQPLAQAQHNPVQDRPILITSSLTIVESAQEPGPVHRATQDLVADFTKVLGRAPKTLDSLNASGPVTLVIAESQNVPAGVGCATTSDRESFALSTTDTGVGPMRRRVICLVGSDMRGTIYAIYEFSQKVLGVDPMYLWTDKQPAKRASITLPADFVRTYSSPVFKYRGFFPNDEDLLTGWVTWWFRGRGSSPMTRSCRRPRSAD
jgi:hypothetical protein